MTDTDLTLQPAHNDSPIINPPNRRHRTPMLQPRARHLLSPTRVVDPHFPVPTSRCNHPVRTEPFEREDVARCCKRLLIGPVTRCFGEEGNAARGAQGYLGRGGLGGEWGGRGGPDGGFVRKAENYCYA